VADRDEDRLDAVLGAQCPTDLLRARRSARDQRGGAAAPGAGLLVGEGERVLGHPDRGQPGEYSEVAGEAETAGVGEPVAVADHETRRARQRVEHGQHGRDLAEGEQPGDVGEGDLSDGGGLGDDGEARRPKPATGATQPVERTVMAALVLSVLAGVGWIGGMIYTVLGWPF
jgi:hypothetical protein